MSGDGAYIVLHGVTLLASTEALIVLSLRRRCDEQGRLDDCPCGVRGQKSTRAHAVINLFTVIRGLLG
jgi:hypothetical protein